MAGKRKADDETIEPASLPVETEGVPAVGVPITDYNVIVNLTKQPRDFTLLDARTAHCGPKLPGRELHRSKPVLKKFLPPLLYDLQRQGIIALETPREEEVSR